MIEPSHPFIAAKPPTTDHLTYLTLLEFNLTKENVVVLGHVLQEDQREGGSLFEDVGWDLVGLLLPFVEAEAAHDTLLEVAKRGNPRECALKVEQALRGIDWESAEDSDDDENDQSDVHPALRAPKSNDEAKKSDVDTSAHSKGSESDSKTPLPLQKFLTLLHMLAILHSRIKTRQPSRFIATTLSAVLAAMAGASPQHHPGCVDEALKLVESLDVSQRPPLPPRAQSQASSEAPPSDKASSTTAEKPADPEAPSDAEIQRKLLQSFLTHVVELWASSLDGDLDAETVDVPALAWSSRFQEQEQPRMIVPDRATMTEQFEQVQVLKAREKRFDRLFALSQKLGLQQSELIENALRDAEADQDDPMGGHGKPNGGKDQEVEDEPPDKAEDVPLSQGGCLFLLAYGQFVLDLKDPENMSNTGGKADADLPIFPHAAKLVNIFIGSPEDVMVSTAAFSNALLDSLLLLSLISISRNSIGDPEESSPDDKDAFVRFLQVISLLSANVPNASLRYCAHVITATVLRSHPEPAVRLSFIRDTMENAPMDLLKAEAVGWLKGEVIEANFAANWDESEHSIFRTSMALDSVSVYLYPDLQTLVPRLERSTATVTATKPLSVFVEDIKPRLPFFLAVLNLHYLLLSMPAQIRERLDIWGLHNEADVGSGFLTPLREVAKKTEENINQNTQPMDVIQQTMSDVMLLRQAVDNVERRLIAIAKEVSS